MDNIKSKVTDQTFCADHKVTEKRIEILEDKLSVVEENTQTVNKLSARVSLLLTIMSFAVMLVTGAAVYTFTGLNGFKDIYNTDRLKLHEQITTMQLDDRKFISNEMEKLESSLDKKVENLSEKVSTLEGKLENIKVKK